MALALIEAFISKNLEDFVSSYAAPANDTCKETVHDRDMERARRSPSEHKDHSADSSFLSDDSCVESLSSDVRETTGANMTCCNTSAMHAHGQDWTQLRNVVNCNVKSTAKQSAANATPANDSFLANVVKEIERLDEELSSMGLLTADPSMAHSHASTSGDDDDDGHDDEEKMDTLVGVQKQDEPPSLQKPTTTAVDTHHQPLPSQSVTIYEADAYFASPPPKARPRRIIDVCSTAAHSEEDKENRMPSQFMNAAIYHASAAKIQTQWKKSQFKSLLVRTFNRHLTQSSEHDLAATVADLLAAATHEIVEHAEKLFAAAHGDDDGGDSDAVTIGNFAYAQLHFCGSPALDWSAVYSMLSSIVLRNVLYYQHSDIVTQILESQRLLNEIVAAPPSTGDAALTTRLVQQLTQLKTKLYQRCQHNMRCNLGELRLFPPNVNIFSRSKSSPSMLHSPRVRNVSDATPLRSMPMQTAPAPASKPELDTIKNQLKLLRQSFSRRKRNTTSFRSSVRSSPQLSASLRSSIEDINGEIYELCSKRVLQTSFAAYRDEPCSPPESPARPSTAPHPHQYDHEKQPFLKRKQQRHIAPAQKVDWSYVKPKTVSRLSEDVRAQRVASTQRARYKPNVVNFRERAASKVDCNWPSAKSTHKSYPKNRNRTKKPVGAPLQNNSNKKFSESHHHSNDNYLFYITKENKVGKISRDSAAAQLHRGRGSMILRATTVSKQPQTSSMRSRVVDARNCDRDHELAQLQETFAQIQAAMKRRRLKQHD